jgi:mannose-6-phosphate isomerase-like protein (cupin superfamily)
MKEFKGNIEKLTLRNIYYRKVINTTENSQLVLMSIQPGDEIGREKHHNTTQFIRIEKGKGVVYIKNKRYNIKDGDAIVIPPNTYHNIINSGKKELKLYSIYSPPVHDPNTKTKLKI